MTRKSVVEEELATDAKLSKFAEKTAESITGLTEATSEKINKLKVELVKFSGSRVRAGVAHQVGIASLRANESVIGFTATKFPFTGVALDIMEKNPTEEWDCDYLLSIAERLYRSATAQSKEIAKETGTKALKGAEAAKAVIEGAESVEAIVATLPPVVARKRATAHRAMDIVSALRQLKVSIQEADTLEIPADQIDLLVSVLSDLAQIQRSMRQVA